MEREMIAPEEIWADPEATAKGYGFYRWAKNGVYRTKYVRADQLESAASPQLLERIRKLEEALRFYADHSWPTREISLGNGQTATGMGLGYPDGSVARQALEDKT